jgi:hypothetical protein
MSEEPVLDWSEKFFVRRATPSGGKFLDPCSIRRGFVDVSRLKCELALERRKYAACEIKLLI